MSTDVAVFNELKSVRKDLQEIHKDLAYTNVLLSQVVNLLARGDAHANE